MINQLTDTKPRKCGRGLVIWEILAYRAKKSFLKRYKTLQLTGQMKKKSKDIKYNEPRKD